MTKSTLKVGDIAPAFTLDDINGKPVSLSDYSKSYVLVAFLRYAGCPWCNLAVHRLAMEQPLLRDSKCEIITFIQSTKEDIQTDIIDRHEVTPLFPIIPDRDMKSYDQYGVSASVTRGIAHHIKNVPAWVRAISKKEFRQTSVDGEYFLAPAVFLLSPESQKIVRADYNANLYEHQAFTDIYESIAHDSLYGN